MTKDVTVVIPTHNRPRQLERLLEYYSKYEIPILIADSSTMPFTRWKKFKNVKYYYYPNFSYAKKLPLIYKKVKTRYVLFNADDDFVIPASILKCVDFLNKNPDYNSAHGHYVFFESNDKKLSVYPFYLASTNLDINSNSPSGRVKQMLSNYMQLLYAVTKTSDIKQVFKLLADNPRIKNDNLVELFQAAILCINGKSKTLPILYCSREVTLNSARTYTKDLNVYYSNPEHQKEYHTWSEAIISHLSKKERVSHDKAKEVVDEAVALYLKNSLLYIPFLKISFTNIQRLANKYSFGLAKKFYDLIYPKKEFQRAKIHAMSKKEGKDELKKIELYIKKYQHFSY